MEVAERGIDDMGVVTVDVVVEPDILRDDIGGGVLTGAGLGGGGGGGEGERVDCTGGGSMSETGLSETSPLPSISGDRTEGGDVGSIEMLFRRGEPVCRGEVLRSCEDKCKALGGAEDI